MRGLTHKSHGVGQDGVTDKEQRMNLQVAAK